MAEDDDPNLMSILIATDVHVGYKEKDPERGKDSFVALEEIFTIAKERNVDFILLGGDLFHENKPSRKTLHSTMELFRKYCLGDRPCSVEVVSDQVVNFGHTSSSVTCVNYENLHMNIGMPVFSIHGNHDDPTGVGELSAIDFLSVAGLLNHFGKQTSLEKIEVSPVLLQKGTTKLALFGLGAMRDERLHRLFLNKLVTYYRPQEDADDWFNLFVLHQNRSKHGATNYIPEQFIDEFFDLVIWGHEHECLIDPQWNGVKNFMVMQPGSSVATSLCEGESKEKHVALLKIKGRGMKSEKIRLRTVRQMYVENVVLSECIRLKRQNPEQLEQASRAYCKERVERLLMKAEDERSGHPKQPIKPLIRLRVDYSGGFEMFNAYRFGAEFANRVANPENIVHYIKKSVKRETGGMDVKDIDAMIGKEVVEKVKMEDLVEEYLNTKDKKDQMTLLSARGVTIAVGEYVEKQEKDAIYELCQHQIKKTKSHILTKEHDVTCDRDDIINEVSLYHDERENLSQENSRKNDFEQRNEIQAILERAREERKARGESSVVPSDEDVMEVQEEEDVPSTRGRRGRGSSTSRGRGRGSRGGSRGGRKATSASGADKSFGAGASIMEAFQRQSQASNSQSRRSTARDDVGRSYEHSSAKSEVKTSTSSRPGQKRGRNKGVVYEISSDEDEKDENPFAGLPKRKQSRR